MADTKAATPTAGPCRIEEYASPQDGRVYFLRILGPRDQRIADLYPDSSVGGVGLPETRANAARILQAMNGTTP